VYTAADLSPLPRCTSRSNKTRSKKTSDGSTVLTSSPYLEKLQKQESNKEMKANKVKSVKRRLVANKPATKGHNKSSSCGSKRQRLAKSTPSTSDVGQEKDVNCLYCNELYSMSRSREVWFKCEKCHKWAHAECAGLNKRQTTFKCEFCVD
jgi:hypothetical protein